MKISMLGHATLLIEIDGKTILTDPWLTDPLYFGQVRHEGFFSPIESLPPIDLLLVSHGHDDHFDPKTVSEIPKTVPVVICDTYEKSAKKAGFTEIHSVRPGDVCSFDTLNIHTLPGKHIGGIATFIITGENKKVFFGGDSESSDELENALSAETPDICLMPISGGRIGPLKFHMNAGEAARLVKSSNAELAIPIHYHFTLKRPSLNRFLLTDNCLETFQAEMAFHCPETEVVVLACGETIDV